MRFEYAARFEDTLRRVPAHDQRRTAETIEQRVRYFETRQAPQGLGLKKLNHGHGGAVLEARISRARRLLFIVRQDVVLFAMVGNHEDVRRFIRSFQ